MRVLDFDQLMFAHLRVHLCVDVPYAGIGARTGGEQVWLRFAEVKCECFGL